MKPKAVRPARGWAVVNRFGWIRLVDLGKYPGTAKGLAFDDERVVRVVVRTIARERSR